MDRTAGAAERGGGVPPRLQGFEILETLGSGAMGVVYKARLAGRKGLVALKIIAPRFSKDPVFVRRLLREARAASEIRHENIVQGIDVGEAGGLHYFAMEYVEGQSLSRLLKDQGPISEAQALSVGEQVARGLKAAAKAGLLHRDIKPANILITPDWKAKLADLGLVKGVGKDDDVPLDGRPLASLEAMDPSASLSFLVEEGKTLTRSGTVLGTPYYMSPEQVRMARGIDIRADIYSLGATLYHAVAGHPPYVGATVSEVFALAERGRIPRLASVRPDVSAAFEALVCRMMAPKAADRFAGPDALLDAMARVRREATRIVAGARAEAVLEAERIPGGAPAPAARAHRGVRSHASLRALPPPSAPRRRSRAPLAAALLVPFLGAAAYLLLAGPGTPPAPPPVPIPGRGAGPAPGERPIAAGEGGPAAVPTQPPPAIEVPEAVPEPGPRPAPEPGRRVAPSVTAAVDPSGTSGPAGPGSPGGPHGTPVGTAPAPPVPAVRTPFDEARAVLAAIPEDIEGLRSAYEGLKAVAADPSAPADLRRGIDQVRQRIEKAEGDLVAEEDRRIAALLAEAAGAGETGAFEAARGKAEEAAARHGSGERIEEARAEASLFELAAALLPAKDRWKEIYDGEWVRLRSAGTPIEGRLVSEDDREFVVGRPNGRLNVRKSEVSQAERITPARIRARFEKEVQEKAAAAAGDEEAAALLEAARLAWQRNLPAPAIELLRKAFAADPDLLLARREAAEPPAGEGADALPVAILPPKEPSGEEPAEEEPAPVAAEEPAPPPPPADAADGPLVSGLRSLTGRTVLLDRLAREKSLFTDRTAYVAPKGPRDEGKTDSRVLSYPPFLEGAEWIRTPNGDRDERGERVISFDLARPARVVLGLDSKLPPPAWMRGWERIEGRVSCRWYHGEATADLYRSPILPRGPVVLGGNPPGGRNYTVFVIPEGAGAPAPAPEAPAPGPAAPFAVQGISARSGKRYEMGRAAPGGAAFADRDYVFQSLPEPLRGLPMLKTACDDKGREDADLLRFETTGRATLYVAYDRRADAIPEWLRGFRKTDMETVISKWTTPLAIYEKEFPRGEIRFGGNLSAGAKGARSPYVVFFRPAGGGE